MSSSKGKLLNKRFLEDFHNVLSHHVDCILKSRMLLDEDMHLMLTFWDPSIYSYKPNYTHTACISTLAAVGIVVSVKSQSLYPVALIVPAALHVYRNRRVAYKQGWYRSNFEGLLQSLFEFYEVNMNIIDYYHRRDRAMHANKLSEDACKILLRPGEEFLLNSTSQLTSIVEKIRLSMLQICELVPISDGEYIYTVDWNLDQFKNIDSQSMTEMLRKFQKLCDIYILIVSNLLSCLGLSFCIQLWKEPGCNFKGVFEKIIPGLLKHVEFSLLDVQKKFQKIRYSLVDPKARPWKPKSVPQLQQPLVDFLATMQITFETAKHVEMLLAESDESSEYDNVCQLVEVVNKHLASCDESLQIFVKSLYVLTRRPISPERITDIPIAAPGSAKTVRYDDPVEVGEDEEYNLSIHGSDDGDPADFLSDITDNCSAEDLELVLYELKKKLEERKAAKGQSVEPKRSPRTSVHIPKIPRLEPPEAPPTQTSSAESLGYLEAVKSAALRMKRDEEVFGFVTASEDFQFGFNMFPDLPRPFNTTYRCFSVAMFPGNEREDVERGGKIIMPPSALEQLTRLNINYPMLFKIQNKKTNRTTHCGVLEFVADEGKVYLPLWMMHNLVLEEGDLIQIESVSLPVGTFAKFQPLSSDFLDITNPKAVLENCLRTFACLTSGDVIAVKYNQRCYELCVLETQPGNAISIIECDMNVEFAPPVGYKEHVVPKHAEEDMMVDPADLMPEPTGFVAFRGAGNRLDGKRRKDSSSTDSTSSKPVYVRGIPDYDYELGTLRFLRHLAKSAVSSEEENEEFKAFSGEGFSLKRRN